MPRQIPAGGTRLFAHPDSLKPHVFLAWQLLQSVLRIDLLQYRLTQGANLSTVNHFP
jgi:hypothetical protein